MFLWSRGTGLLREVNDSFCSQKTTVTFREGIEQAGSRGKQQARELPHRSVSTNRGTIQHRHARRATHAGRRNMRLCQRTKHRWRQSIRICGPATRAVPSRRSMRACTHAHIPCSTRSSPPVESMRPPSSSMSAVGEAIIAVQDYQQGYQPQQPSPETYEEGEQSYPYPLYEQPQAQHPETMPLQH